MTSKRPLAERVRAFALGVLAGAIGGVLLMRAALVNEPSAVVVIVPIALLVGFTVERLLGSIHGMLRLVRLGTREEKLAAAEHLRVDVGSRMLRAALAIDRGDLEAAAARFAEKRQVIEFSAIEEIVTAQYALACGAKNALERLVAVRPAGSFVSCELDRYHAYVLATAFVDARLDDRARAVTARLLEHGDAEVRGYGTWLLFSDEELQRASSSDFAIGAALAKAAGRVELAVSLDQRAAKAAAGAVGGPYRGA